MNVQWYPGHMTRARREMEANLKLVDVIVELRDARLPSSSANPDLAEMGRGKKRILVMNKADLADPSVTEQWLAAFRQQKISALDIDARQKKQVLQIFSLLREAAAEKKERDLARGIKNRPVRIMIAGIPNCGKSTLINSLAGKASARTGDKPGVTKGLQWIRLDASLELLDTPGILWPKFEDEAVGVRLALVGSIREEVLPLEELAERGVHLLEERYPGRLSEVYGFEPVTERAFLERLAEKQGFLEKGGQFNYEKAASRFLDDWQKGKLGRISLEGPNE